MSAFDDVCDYNWNNVDQCRTQAKKQTGLAEIKKPLNR